MSSPTDNFGTAHTPNPSGLVDCHSMQGYLALVRARDAPKTVLAEATYDVLDPTTQPASKYYAAAAESFARADQILGQLGKIQPNQATRPRIGLWLGQALLALARRDFGSANHWLGIALKHQPNHLLVLMLAGRLYLQTRRVDQALRTYQHVLRLAPQFGVPPDPTVLQSNDTAMQSVMKLALDQGLGMDPRVGLGLSFWLLGDARRAQLAWTRAINLNPHNRGARFLLALVDLNDSKASSTANHDDATKRSKQVASTKSFGRLFQETHGKFVAPALGLVRNAEVQGQLPRAIKLAERAIQYADTTAHYRRAMSERCRLAFAQGNHADIETYAAKLSRGDGTSSTPNAMPDPIVEIVRAQVFIKSGTAFYREALNVVDIAVTKLGGEKHAPPELQVLHALLLAFPHPGMSAPELLVNAKRARDVLTRLHAVYKAASSGKAELREIANDPLVFCQLAKMWQGENEEKAVEAYQTAIEIYTRVHMQQDQLTNGDTDATSKLMGIKLSNNLGALYLNRGNVEEAMQMFEQLLSDLGTQVNTEEEEIMQAILLYNLGRAYEGAHESEKAIEAYRGLLAKHPEHLHAKIRLSSLLHAANKLGEEDVLLKEANASHPKDPLLRAYITYYLARNEKWKDVSDFAHQTRRGNANDIQALCALGAYHYRLARESKTGGKELDQLKDYCRAAEAYNRALEIDPRCAVACQGLAIAIAEDHLSKHGASANASSMGGGVLDAHGSLVKSRNLDVALAVFIRIRDCLPTQSVLVNIGHCYAFKGEEEKAIEMYTAALDMAKGNDPTVLLFLARAHYQLGGRQSDHVAMTKALERCQQAAQLKPTDKAIQYNIAMIQQKSAEIVLGLDPSNRSLVEVEQVIEQAKQSTEIFQALAEAPERPLPYDVDLVEQRQKYGQGLLRRADDQIQRQSTWETEQAEKHAHAVAKRAEERRRLEEIEQAKRQEEQAKRDAEAEVRERQRLEAQAWREQIKAAQDDEERARAERAEIKEGKRSSKKSRKEKEDGFVTDGDEEAATAAPRQKKKKGKKEAAVDPDDSDRDSTSSRSRSRSKVGCTSLSGVIEWCC